MLTNYTSFHNNTIVACFVLYISSMSSEFVLADILFCTVETMQENLNELNENMILSYFYDNKNRFSLMDLF